MTLLLSGRLNSINGATLSRGVDMQLVSSISLNGKTYTPSKGAVDLGNIEGGGGIATETDPVFSASPAASITEAKKNEWDNKVDKVEGKGLSTNDFTDEEKAQVAEVENKANKNGRYLDLAAGYYIEKNVELSGEMRSGNLNAAGGITNSSTSNYLLIDISNVPNDSTIRVSTTYNSEYTTLWTLWEVAYDPATVNWKYLLDKGPLCSVAQSADIDLSRYEGRAPRYLYVGVGTKGDSASATVLQPTKNIAEKFDEIEESVKQPSDWLEDNPSSPAFIKNRTHYFQPYTSEQQLIVDSTTVGTNMVALYDYFKLGGAVYKSADMVGVEFNCQNAGGPVFVTVVEELDSDENLGFYLRHISGNSSAGAPIMISPAGNVKTIDDAYIPNGVARTKDLNVRNVCIVDTEAEIDDTISFATTEYVNTAIATAITTTLNTPV